MSSVVDTNIFPVYSKRCAHLFRLSYRGSIISFQNKISTTDSSDTCALLDGELFSKPTHKTNQRFCVLEQEDWQRYPPSYSYHLAHCLPVP